MIDGITIIFDDVAATESDMDLMLLFDGMVAGVSTVLNRLHLRLRDQVQYIAVKAGSETFQPVPCLYDNQRFEQDAVLADPECGSAVWTGAIRADLMGDNCMFSST